MLVSAAAAILLHRNGHTQGDDFALYLRQARSIFDGDSAQVIADNRLAVLNSNDGFSPIGYPWGWPLILSPFVHVWGLDYDRLKLIEVALLCAWLVLVHGIIRRRVGRPIALGVVAVFGTTLSFLTHTDELLSEFPHLVAVALVIWWYDRVRERTTLIAARTGELAVLGGLVVVAFNMRREGIVLVGVIAILQLGELGDRASAAGFHRWKRLWREVRDRWRPIVTPHLTFFVGAVLFQLMLPTDLLPESGNSRTHIPDRFAEYPSVLTKHLGIGDHPAIGVTFIVLALVGAVLGMRRRPALDGVLVLTALFSALTISTHFRLVDRYWFQVDPWVLYFAVVGVVELARFALRRRERWSLGLAVLPILWLVIVHVVVVPSRIGDARDFDDSGRKQVGPTNAEYVPIFEAVRTYTPPDAIIDYFRARTMTLLTDRVAIQQTNIDRIREHADYFAQHRGTDYWQPRFSLADGVAMGFEVVWQNPDWILWKVAPPDVALASVP